VKTKEEIQRAHDILAALILQEVPLRLDPEALQRIHGSADVLCWLLDHEHNRSFQNNLERIEAAFKEMNIEEIRSTNE
jgi:hypothetical protein